MTGDQLRELRESQMKTREELATWLGDCSASTINKWERGINPVPQWVAEKMLSKVQITLPLEDLSTLITFASNRKRSFESILAEAIMAHVRKPTASIHDFQDSEPDPKTQGLKVAEEPTDYRIKKK